MEEIKTLPGLYNQERTSLSCFLKICLKQYELGLTISSSDTQKYLDNFIEYEKKSNEVIKKFY